ncbi:MAG TPA: protein kinase [Thermoleophilaceae bacterium]|nr:protein kinase [Thermoleophilaceae bacterium]
MAQPGEIAGRYRIERRLGAGGMSTVFLAQDTVLERPVAVKLLAEHLADDEAFVARFQREALAAARLQHPNVVQVFDYGLDATSHRHFIVMEFVDGPSCADLLRDRKRLDIDETVRIARDACHGLDYAHRAGVVHRDVKPGNLLLSAESGTTKLADFGIAKAAEQTRITQVGSVLGTAAYLSPEQAHGDEAGPRSDTYSLGVCAYQLLTGRLPHEYGSLTELALKQREEPIEPISELRPEVPLQLDLAIRVSLERDPADRYDTALDFARALEAGLHGEETEATRRLAAAAAVADPDATRALGDVTDATQALRTRQRAPVAPLPLDDRGRAVSEAAADPKAVKRSARNRRWGQFLLLLAVLMAIAAVALVLLSSGDGGNGVAPVDRDSVQQQIDGIEQFLRDNTR